MKVKLLHPMKRNGHRLEAGEVVDLPEQEAQSVVRLNVGVFEPVTKDASDPEAAKPPVDEPKAPAKPKVAAKPKPASTDKSLDEEPTADGKPAEKAESTTPKAPAPAKPSAETKATEQPKDAAKDVEAAKPSK